MRGEDFAISAGGLGGTVLAEVDHPALAGFIAQEQDVLLAGLVVDRSGEAGRVGLHRRTPRCIFYSRFSGSAAFARGSEVPKSLGAGRMRVVGVAGLEPATLSLSS